MASARCSGTSTLVPAYGKTKIEFKGEELRQDDLRVFNTLIRMGLEGRAGPQLNSIPENFHTKLWAGVTVGAASKSLRIRYCGYTMRKVGCTTYMRRAKKEVFQGISFITEFTMEKGEWSIQLSPSLVTLLTGWYRSFMKASERMSMKDGLGSWLYGVIKLIHANWALT